VKFIREVCTFINDNGDSLGLTSLFGTLCCYHSCENQMHLIPFALPEWDAN
jgi:hypothetical protein